MSETTSKGIVQPQGITEDPLTAYTRLFVKFLQVIFATFEKGSYHWERDERLTDIIISDQAGYAKEVVEKRPAIVVRRGAMQMANLTMNQQAGPQLTRTTFTPNVDIRTGFRAYTDLCQSSMTLNCLSSNGIEAQRIAWICAYAIRTLKTTLMRAGMHRVGEDIAIGPESEPGELVSSDPNEILLVPVTVPFYFQLSWTVEPLDKFLLTHINIALRSEVRSPVIRPPSMNGQPLNIVKSISITQTRGSNNDGGSTP